MPESAVAAYLTELAAKVEPQGVKVGSYPRWGKKWNTVTLVGRYGYRRVLWIPVADLISRDPDYLERLVPDVLENVEGKRVTDEGDNDSGGEDADQK